MKPKVDLLLEIDLVLDDQRDVELDRVIETLFGDSPAELASTGDGDVWLFGYNPIAIRDHRGLDRYSGSFHHFTPENDGPCDRGGCRDPHAREDVYSEQWYENEDGTRTTIRRSLQSGNWDGQPGGLWSKSYLLGLAGLPGTKNWGDEAAWRLGVELGDLIDWQS